MELKANELRLNNLCYRTNKLTKEKILIELTASCILDISANGEMSSFIYEPIQLTEEWLFKCGFDKGSDFLGDCFFIEFDSIDDFVLHIKKDGYYWSYNQIKVNTLHQLQNLYFSLTNEELTIKM